MKPMTLREMEQAKKRVLDNSRELVEEAELLLKYKHYARAYSLAHLAREELCKLPMLQRAAIEHAITGKFNWRKLEKRLSSHFEKIDAMLLHDYLLDLDIERYQRKLNFLKNFNLLKNAGFYAGFFEGKFRKPKEIIRSRLARNGVKWARNQLKQFERAEQTIGGQIVRMKPARLKKLFEGAYGPFLAMFEKSY